MRKSTKVAMVLACLCVASLSSSAGWENKPALGDLSWLAGCWEGGQGDRRWGEMWTKPAGGTMLGVGRVVAGGKTVEFEFLRLHEEGGEIFFTARPSGQAEASFKLVALSKEEAVFENPAHDFPQRIIYRRQSDGSLHARIEGEKNGKRRGSDFPFRRVKCE
jgi:hypothetical protein